MRLSRRWALLLFLYISMDFMDPSIPGVFFFDGKDLFVDGVVQLKATSSGHLVAMEPMPLGSSADHRDDQVAASARAYSRRSVPRQTCRQHLKHDDSASVTSSAPPDSSSILASS